MVITEDGMSRRVWLTGDVERSFWRTGNGELSRLLQQAIRWVARDRMPVRVSGEGLVELFAWETEPGYAIHILNYTNPNSAMGWFRRHESVGRADGAGGIAGRHEGTQGTGTPRGHGVEA